MFGGRDGNAAVPAGETATAAAAAPQAAVGHAARIDAPAVRRPRPPSAAAAAVAVAAADAATGSRRGRAGPEPSRGRPAPEPGGTRGRAGRRAENRRHAAQAGIPTETRARRRDPPVAAAAATPATTTPAFGRRRDPGRRGTGNECARTRTRPTASARQRGRGGDGGGGHGNRVVGRVQRGPYRRGRESRPTAAPGHDAAAGDRGGGTGRPETRAAVAARVRGGPADAATATTPAAAVEQREPVERNDPELVPTRPNHPAGAKGHQGAGRGVLHVRVPVDAVLRAQPVAVHVPGLQRQHQQGPHRPGHVAGLRQFHGQPGVLHDIQQGVPAGVQAGAHVQVSGPQQAALVAAAAHGPEGVTNRPRLVLVVTVVMSVLAPVLMIVVITPWSFCLPPFARSV